DSEFLGDLLCSLAPLGSVLDRTDSLIGPVQRQNERRHVILHWFTRRIFIRSPRRRANLGILKDGRERGAAAIRERIHPALTIVRDESPDGHGLHRMVSDADRAVDNAGRDAEQNHAVLCVKFCRRLFHRQLPPPALDKGEGSHYWLRSGWPSAVVWATHGRVIVIAVAALRVLGNSPRL